jgi:hypothetical protein
MEFTQEQLVMIDILYSGEWEDFYWKWFTYLCRLEETVNVC